MHVQVLRIRYVNKDGSLTTSRICPNASTTPSPAGQTSQLALTLQYPNERSLGLSKLLDMSSNTGYHALEDEVEMQTRGDTSLKKAQRASFLNTVLETNLIARKRWLP